MLRLVFDWVNVAGGFSKNDRSSGLVHHANFFPKRPSFAFGSKDNCHRPIGYVQGCAVDSGDQWSHYGVKTFNAIAQICHVAYAVDLNAEQWDLVTSYFHHMSHECPLDVRSTDIKPDSTMQWGCLHIDFISRTEMAEQCYLLIFLLAYLSRHTIFNRHPYSCSTGTIIAEN